jgi:ribosomal protein S18 acetylase RimI-like enzyme
VIDMLLYKETDVKQEFRLRDAVKMDCAEIAKLFLIASDGLAEYIWGKSVEAKLDLERDILEVGEKRYAREGVDFSWQNCRIMEVNGRIAGMLMAYKVPDEVDVDAGSGNDVVDPVLKPYTELEIPGSFYVAGIAVHARYRGMGLGKQLMLDAQARAVRQELNTVSLICFEENVRAMQMYRKLGYREHDRRAIVPQKCLRYTEGHAILMAL